MNKFILRIVYFFSFLFILFLIGLFLPSTPRASKSFLFAQTAKDSLLANVPSPRIIFVGGSSMSFGLNSQMIKDSFNLNPINTGINGDLGLIYMMDNTIGYVKKGDIVVIAPEYFQFYGDYAYGSTELLWTVLDVSPKNITKLRKQQWQSIYPYILRYSFSKFKPTEYFHYKVSDIYGIHSFNEYGDVSTHWKYSTVKFEPLNTITDKFNSDIINELLNFKEQIIKKGATLYVTFPGLQATSYDKCKAQINDVETELKNNKFLLLGNAERYKFADSLMFNTPYHLLKKGLDIRTRLLVENLKKFIK